jgi:hypothetical protein
MSDPGRDMKRAQVAVVAVVLVAMLACVALIVEAGRRIYHSIGPSKAVAGADGSLYVLSHGKLHIFSRDGTRREAIALDSLGITRMPSELALHRDGRAVFADPDTSLLHRCALPKGPCEALDLRLHHVDVQQFVPLNSIKIAVDDEHQRYYISDNAGHAIVIASFDGQVLARSSYYAVRHPNHLFVEAPGELTVVDTDHHRLATFDVHGDKVGRLVRSMDADRSPVTRPGRRWPFDAVRVPGGGTAVLIADDGMKDADLVLFDGAGTPVRRLDLGASSDPFDIELWNGRLIVADATLYRLQAVSLDGVPAADFPSAAFVAELDAARAVPERWRAVRQAARIAMVVVPLVAIAALWGLARRQPAPPLPGAVPSAPVGVVREAVFRYDASSMRRTNRWLIVSGVLVAAALIMHIVLVSRQVPALLHSPSGRVALAWVAAAWIAVPILFSACARITRRLRAGLAIEVTTHGLRIAVPGAAGSTVTFESPWSAVYSDERRLLAGSVVVRIRGLSSAAAPDQSAFEHIVQHRIPMANRVSGLGLGVRAARAGNLFFILAFVALFVSLTYLVLGFPGWLP